VILTHFFVAWFAVREAAVFADENALARRAEHFLVGTVDAEVNAGQVRPERLPA
jgi:hypothetical protein